MCLCEGREGKDAFWTALLQDAEVDTRRRIQLVLVNEIGVLS